MQFWSLLKYFEKMAKSCSIRQNWLDTRAWREFGNINLVGHLMVSVYKRSPPYSHFGTFKNPCYKKFMLVGLYTANVYWDLQGLCGEIGVRGFQIYGDCMYNRNPCNFVISTLWFPCRNCRDFDFTGILWGYPTLNVGKSCNKIIFVDISVKFVGISCKF